MVPPVEPQSWDRKLAVVMTMGFGGMWLWMILGLIALWVLVACAIRWTIGPGRPTPSTDPVLVLKERLARGEIDAEEYRRVRDLLTNGH